MTWEGNAGRERNITAARPVDHASRMEASRVRLFLSRKLYLSTAVIICETRVTIGRTLEMLRIGPPPDARDDRPKTEMVFPTLV